MKTNKKILPFTLEEQVEKVSDVIESKKDEKVVKIKVVGIGGGGCNAIDFMKSNNSEVECIAINTDEDVLKKSKADTVIQIGKNKTKGQGAGMLPEMGKEAAEEDIAEIEAMLEDTDMLFITSGMGGGTGTGATPVVAEVAKRKKILTVAIVTLPFLSEGNRMGIAKKGLENIKGNVDSLIVIENENLITNEQFNQMSLDDAFEKVDEVLYNAVMSVYEIIYSNGKINVDFADVKTVMAERGNTLMGSGRANGKNRATNAIDDAINSPLLKNVSLKNIKGLLINISSANKITVGELKEINNYLEELEATKGIYKFGYVMDDKLGEDLKITIIATGLKTEVEEIISENQAIMNEIEIKSEELLINNKPMGNSPRVIKSNRVDNKKDNNDIMNNMFTGNTVSYLKEKDEEENRRLEEKEFEKKESSIGKFFKKVKCSIVENF